MTFIGISSTLSKCSFSVLKVEKLNIPSATNELSTVVKSQTCPGRNIDRQRVGERHTRRETKRQTKKETEGENTDRERDRRTLIEREKERRSEEVILWACLQKSFIREFKE